MPQDESPNDSLFLQMLAEEKQQHPHKPSPKKSPKKPKKKGKKGGKKGGRKNISFVVLLSIACILFLVIISLLVFTMTIGGAGNPVIAFFGQDEDTLQGFLLRLINGSFGILSVLLLITVAVSLFFGITQPKKQVKKRSVAFALSITSFGLLFIAILVWLGMYNFIDGLEVIKTNKKGEIIMVFPDGKQLMSPFSPEDTEGLIVPFDIRFSANGILQELSKNNLPVRKISWDLNGSHSYIYETKESYVDKRFERSGIHEIGVEITLDDAESTKVIKRTTFEVPTGSFRASPQSGPLPLHVEFNASGISESFLGKIVTYEWDVDGDRITDEVTPGPVFSHTFVREGKYTVNLTLVGRQRTLYRYSTIIDVTKRAQDPISIIIKTFPESTSSDQNSVSIKKNDTMTFSAEETKSIFGNMREFEWFFSDTVYTKRGASISRKFETPGEIEVTLRTKDIQGNTSEKKIYVTVHPERTVPTPHITSIPPQEDKVITGVIPLTVTFDASSSTGNGEDIEAYEWDFDSDGIIDAVGEDVTHTYSLVGEYSGMLTVRNPGGESMSTDFKVDALPHALEAKIIATPESAQVPCIVDFDGSLSSCAGCNILGYRWDYGDGQSSELTNAHVQHPYSTVGKFDVSLTVFTATEETTTTKRIFCTQVPINACFTASKPQGTAPFRTTFQPDCTTGTVTRWLWNFGDGTTSSEQIPTHLFQKKGIHMVKLTVVDSNGNTDSYTSEVIAQ